MRDTRHPARAVAALAAALLLAACGSSAGAGSASVSNAASTGRSSSASRSGGSSGARSLQGLVLTPSTPAPPLALRNFTGQPVSLASQRGKVAFVTFVYTHCPDVCPLIVSKLAEAQRELGAQAHHVAIIAVTVDPKRDTPHAVRRFLAERGALGRMDYLIGSQAALLPIWKAWNVEVTQVKKSELTGGHTAIIYGITAGGRVAVVFPANFSPSQILHDVPLLERT